MRFICSVALLFVLSSICISQTPMTKGPLGKLNPARQAPFKRPIPPEDMVLIPSGEFEMGDHFGVGDPDELPVHAVYLDAYYIDTQMVSNQAYCRFLNSAYGMGTIEVGGSFVFKAGDIDVYCSLTPGALYGRINWDGQTFFPTAGTEDHPMTQVTWYGALAYANWRGVREGRTTCYDLDNWTCSFGVGGYRLPTEAEWEKAARGGKYTPYRKFPWGDSLDWTKANYWASGDPFEQQGKPYTTPVDFYDVNGYGLHDMAGNLFEWCNDAYSSTYYSWSPYANPTGPASGTARVLRGGSWAYGEKQLRCAHRYNYAYPEGGLYYFGFRLVLETPKPV